MPVIIIIALFLNACGNRFEVPADINTNVNGTVKVDIPNSVQTVNVVHTVGISIDMANYFRTSCTAQVDAAPIPLPEPQRTEAINTCVAQSVQAFIDNILKIINQGVPK
jgi:hypothetical protein